MTDITWNTVEEQFSVDNIEFNNERDNYIQTKVNENKTDGVGYALSDVTTRRLWVDQASAQGWVDFITSLAQTHNITVVKTEILDQNFN